GAAEGPEGGALGPAGPAAAAAEGRIDHFEPPVDMVRVVVPGARPMHTIDGWPASFWRPAGRGWVLFTTVAPRGWISPRAKNDPRGADAEDFAGFEASEPLRRLAHAFLRQKAGPPLGARGFGPPLGAHVGPRGRARSA